MMAARAVLRSLRWPFGPRESWVATVFPRDLDGYKSVRARTTSKGARKA